MMTTLYGAIPHGKRNILMLCGKTGFHKDERLYDDYVQVQSAGVLCPWEVGENPALSRSGDGNERHTVHVDHALPLTEVGSDA